MSSNRWNCGNGYLQYACGPYYAGPCPNANGVCDEREARGDDGRRGRDCCCQRRGGRDEEQILKAQFASPTPLTVTAGAAVPLIACGRPSGMIPVGGAVQIEDAGVYYASITATLPGGKELTTTLTPTLNGAMLPAGIVEVAPAAARALPIFSGQVIFRARGCDHFAVTTSEAITSTAAAPLINVELMRIGE